MLKPVKKFLQQIAQLIRLRKGIKQEPVVCQIKPPMSWVIPGKLAVGRSPRAADGTVLAAANIKVIFSLCANSEKSLPEEFMQLFRCLRLVLPDSHYATEIKVKQLAAAVDIVQHSIESQLPILVHCLAGVERSPTVCIAYLCRHHNLELWEAINWLKRVHPSSMPTESQIRVVREFLEQPSLKDSKLRIVKNYEVS
ncbi:MAG: dual specificity protein phosphatase [Leptolyngbyaceae bacterium]|nr:dual specificity protein phosphatase [Leptolyngbyaceae bacterium]